MTEQRENELRREGFVAGAKWATDNFHRAVHSCLSDTEAARRYPTIDVQQGPSGRWYRVVDARNCETGQLVIRGWDNEQAARADLGACWLGILPGDESTVAQMLTRHAERAT